MSSSPRPLAVVVELSAREPSDSALVSRVRTGVRSAEEALYMRHVGRVLSLCLRLLGDRDEAEDVLQDTFLDAFERLDELRDAASFGRFLTRIAVEKADALFRQRRARRFVLARSLATEGLTFLRPRAGLDAELRAQLSQLDTALAKLRDRDRACWLLHNVDGHTLEEVASLTHRPLAIVTRREARAERSLRDTNVPGSLARLLDDGRPANARHLLEALQARRALRGRPARFNARVLRASLGVLLVLGLLLLGVGRHARHEPSALTMRDQRSLPSSLLTAASWHAFDLSDGSRVTLAAGSRIDVLENSAHELVLALRRGRARFDVRPQGPRTWRVESAELSVEVVGTRFVIERAQHAVRVRVDEGALVVRGKHVPDHVQRLTRGQTFVAE